MVQWTLGLVITVGGLLVGYSWFQNKSNSEREERRLSEHTDKLNATFADAVERSRNIQREMDAQRSELEVTTKRFHESLGIFDKRLAKQQESARETTMAVIGIVSGLIGPAIDEESTLDEIVSETHDFLALLVRFSWAYESASKLEEFVEMLSRGRTARVDGAIDTSKALNLQGLGHKLVEHLQPQPRETLAEWDRVCVDIIVRVNSVNEDTAKEAR
jgi:hypothetical protein